MSFTNILFARRIKGEGNITRRGIDRTRGLEQRRPLEMKILTRKGGGDPVPLKEYRERGTSTLKGTLRGGTSILKGTAGAGNQ
jgi:hypothetical protein